MSKIIVLSILIFAFNSCVESLNDAQQSVSPTIEITHPVTGDSVMFGATEIDYKAVDGTGGGGLSFYEVYLNKKFVKKIEQNTDGTNPKLTLSVDSTFLGSKINYSVKVYNKNNRSKESSLQENIYVKDKKPNAPANLFLSKINEFSVSLLWDDLSHNESGFELWRKDEGGGAYRRIKTLPSNTISTTDGGLSAFASYFYKVRAYNNSGFSDFSNEVSTTSVPGGPWNLVGEAIGASQVNLKWVDFAINENGFVVERTDPATTEYKRLTTVPPNTIEYQDNSVAPSTGYKYRVAYFTNTSISGFSNEATVATFYVDVPGPSNLRVSLGINIVNLTWDDNTSLENQVIIERKTGDGNFVEFLKLAADSKSAIDGSVQRGFTYQYRVRQSLAIRTYTPYSNTVTILVQ
ncbi:MAG: fibronectin type III domain-containing protein [Melioribacteraceae bacterium]|nr:fibronectin type III domain-containing protein [Melioribacteraceae bacterium]